MTDKIEWGAPLEGKLLKEWNLPGDTLVRFSIMYPPGKYNELALAGPHYQLPADHPAYTVQAWNEAHPGEEPFVPWCGGDEAPGDWDGGCVLFRDGWASIGVAGPHTRWGHVRLGGDIIGYRRRKEPASEPVAPPGYVLVKQMSEGEARRKFAAMTPERVVSELGAIRPETRLEQFERESGIAITDGNRDAVVAALEWATK